MFTLTFSLGILLCLAGSQALYETSSDVVVLTPSNFDNLVTKSDEIWIVEFYAPWCGHCKNLVPEYKKAAKALKGIVKVGALDANEHSSFASKYGVSGFPTIKFFTGSKNTPYQGQRTAEAFVDAALKVAKEKAYENLGKKSGGSSDKLAERSGVFGHSIPWLSVAHPDSNKKKSTTDDTISWFTLPQSNSTIETTKMSIEKLAQSIVSIAYKRSGNPQKANRRSIMLKKAKLFRKRLQEIRKGKTVKPVILKNPIFRFKE